MIYRFINLIILKLFEFFSKFYDYFRYAVYVQTRLVNHPGALNGISKIHFVRTMFAVPDPPRMNPTRSISLDSRTIIIQWDPPLNPLGVITHYTVVWTLEKPTRPPGNPCENSARGIFF